MTRRRIYLLFQDQGSWEQDYLLGIYSTKGRANRALKVAQKTTKAFLFIDDYPLDPPKPKAY